MSDDAITKERIEAIGFRRGTFGYHLLGIVFIDTNVRGCPVYIGSVTHGGKSIDAVRTMTQLTNLMKALRGEA